MHNQCPVCRTEITLESLKKQKKEVNKLLNKIRKQNKKNGKDKDSSKVSLLEPES